MKRELPVTNSSPALSNAMHALVIAAMPEDITTAPRPPSRAVNFSSRMRFVGLVAPCKYDQSSYRQRFDSDSQP